MTEASGDQVPLDDVYKLVGLDPPSLSRADIASRTGVPLERSIRWWRAMGLPEIDDNEVAFRPEDAEVVLSIDSLVSSGFIDDADVLRLARVMGSSFSRLVDAQLDVIQGLLEQPSPPTPNPAMDDGVIAFVEHTMNYVWRRHLIASLGHRSAVGDVDAEQAVGFVDLSGFTRLSRSASAAEITRVVETFEVAAFDVVASRHGRVIKMIGDEVMFVAATFGDAFDIELELIRRLGASDFMPKVHGGVAWGPTVTIGGDVFGPTVNLAARLTKIARPGTIATTRAMAEQLTVDDDLEIRRIRRAYDFKGVGRTTVAVIRQRRPERNRSAGE